jgi:ankyrin repeat protein
MDTPLHKAVKTCNLTLVQKLLKTNININALNYKRETPLHKAIPAYYHIKHSLRTRTPSLDMYSNNLNIIRALLNAGADVNAINNNGETPLHIAISVCDIKIVKILLEFGADPKALYLLSIHQDIYKEIIDLLYDTPIKEPEDSHN